MNTVNNFFQLSNIALFYFVPFLVTVVFNVIMITRLYCIPVQVPDTITRKDLIHGRNSVIVVSPRLWLHLTRRIRTTLITVILLTTCDMLINMPKYLADIGDHIRSPSLDTAMEQVTQMVVTNVIWHLQFLLAPLFIWFPFIQRDVANSPNSSQKDPKKVEIQLCKPQSLKTKRVTYQRLINNVVGGISEGTAVARDKIQTGFLGPDQYGNNNSEWQPKNLCRSY